MPLCENHCGTDYSDSYGWYIEHNEGCDDDGTYYVFRSGVCSVECLVQFAMKIQKTQPPRGITKARSDA
jgi:hypothetical protein